MVDPRTTRQFVIIWLLALGCSCIGYPKDELDTKWMAPLEQYGWRAQHLKNKVEHGDVTTFELGTPNYQILNPEDEPEYITADQPHYQEMLKELTNGQNGTETIDMDLVGKADSYKTVHVSPEKSEKLKKRSFDQVAKRQEQENVEPKAAVQKIQVYAGARPFQRQIVNLS